MHSKNSNPIGQIIWLKKSIVNQSIKLQFAIIERNRIFNPIRLGLPLEKECHLHGLHLTRKSLPLTKIILLAESSWFLSKHETANQKSELFFLNLYHVPQILIWTGLRPGSLYQNYHHSPINFSLINVIYGNLANNNSFSPK